MLSPKMQRGVRINDNQLLMLAEKARYDQYMCGSLYKRTSDNSKWQMRWFNLYQNMLFYYDNESSSRPSGVILLEGCYCERLVTAAAKPKDTDPQYCLSITYRRENQRQYDLRANSESECKSWIEAIRHASFNRLLLQKEELEQKHLHLLQIVESEKTAKWQYSQQCDELTTEIKKLRNELCSLKKDWRFLPRQQSEESEESDEIKKIKKVQSFFRGWLCRRRWKQIVEEYIKSPHAESMRKRNSLVFRMVEAEEEYVEQLNILVTGFLRPFKMAASSKLPPCSHEDVNSIFLNSETLLFLHQIFLKGLSARMESWPTLVLGDLFDMLLPMLSIYQEYVRNHHYSLQVLTECKQNSQFSTFLSRLENKSTCQGRNLETFLTYPMHQIPRYIITLHELLAHTPHNHVERRSLDEARKQLEQLSRQMHDEVSETENIRKNLAIERMIVEGCDILLDVNQVFVRQGSLVHILPEKQQRKTPKIRRGPLDGFSRRTDRDKELIRQCFLFSNHLILATRTNSGHLHLINGIGRVSLADAILIEDPSENDDDLDSETSSSTSSLSDNSTVGQLRREHIGLDFKLIVERKGDTHLVLHLVAPTAQEKAAWVSDIAQCLDNVQFNNWFRSSVSDTSSVTMPHSIRNDPKLFRDDIDIRFSKTLNSCKVPQVRYATPERLLERLTDLRFLSIDFLNTFLLTYRVFTDGVTVLNALKTVYFSAEKVELDDPTSPPGESRRRESSLSSTLRIGHGESSRRISTASTVSCVSACSEGNVFDSLLRGQHWRWTYRRSTSSPRTTVEEEPRGVVEAVAGPSTSSLAVGGLQQIKEQPSPSGSDCSSHSHFIELRDRDQEGGQFLSVPATQGGGTGAGSDSSSDTLVGTLSERTLTSLTAGDSGGARPDLQETQWETVVETRRDVAAVPIAAGPDLTRRTSGSERPAELERTQSGPPELEPGGMLRERNDVIKEEEEEEDAVPEGERSEGDGAEEQKAEESKAKTEAEIAHETRRKRKLYQKSESIVLETEEPWLDRSFPSFTPRGSTSMSCSDAFSIPRTSGYRYEEWGERCSVIVPVEPVTPDYAVLSEFTCRKMCVGGRHPCRLLELFTLEENSDTLSIPRGSSAFSDAGSTARSASEYGDPLSTPRGSTFSRASEGQLLLPKAAHKRLSTNSAPPMVGRSDSGPHHTPRTSFQYPPDSPQSVPRAGVVVTSSRQSQRRSSSSSAASAFAIATAGSSNPRDHPTASQKPWTVAERRQSCKRQESIVSTAATMRVLNVLRHWVSKHFQDFESDTQLKNLTIEFLEDVMGSRSILPTEHKAASQLYHMITREEPVRNRVTLDRLLAPPLTPSEESIDTLSALDIAEQMTYLDHQIFMAIRSEEFLCQNWMKPEKTQKAPHIVMITRRFNEMSMLVVSSVLKNKNSSDRVQVIEKWAAVGDICRCLQNFNGVLQICAAFTNTPVFRLKRTWEKVSKTAKQTVSRLQKLVSFEGNFRNLRDTLHRCDPPCIPYLGMYLTELSFIEEGTPNFTDDGLLNFAKMRMIAHVIRENRRFQQTPYKIEYNAKVSAYLLDSSACGLGNDDLYEMSLSIEPRTSRISSLTVPSSHGGDGATKIKPRLSMGNLGRTLVYTMDSRRSSFS